MRRKLKKVGMMLAAGAMILAGCAAQEKEEQKPDFSVCGFLIEEEGSPARLIETVVGSVDGQGAAKVIQFYNESPNLTDSAIRKSFKRVDQIKRENGLVSIALQPEPVEFDSSLTAEEN